MSEPSWQDLYDLGKSTLIARRALRGKVVVVEEGDVYDAIIAGCATMATAIVAYAEARYRACFLDGAEGADLTSLAHDRGVDRDPGSQAIGSITLTRASATAGAGTIPAGTKIQTEPDATGATVTFITDTDAVFGALDLTKTVNGRAVEIGKSGNIEIGALARITDTVFDSTILPSNAARFTGGIEEEGDQDLRDRVRAFFLTQARGTIEALIFGAKQVPGVDRVSVVVDAAGVVTVYVADEDGNSNQTMVDLVDEELENGGDDGDGWRAAGDIVNAASGALFEQAVDMTLTVRAGTDVNALLDRVRNAVSNRARLLNPNETLFLDAIQAAARDVDREAILGVRINNPLVNIVPVVGQSIRIPAGDVTFS